MEAALDGISARLDELAMDVGVLSARLDAVAVGGSSASAAPPSSAAAPAAAASTSALLGRWVWKSRRLQDSSRCVVWDMQAVNAAPDNYGWGGTVGRDEALGPLNVDEATVVRVRRPGLYKVAMGFFASVPPGITLLVNGVPALSTAPHHAAGAAVGDGVDDAAGAGLSASSHALAAGGAAANGGVPDAVMVGPVVVHRHPSGSVAGLSLLQFLALPADALLAVVYEGPMRGQGFLELTKL